MSVKVMAAVFESNVVNPTEKLVLLALGDHASEDGLNIYPSVETICKKTALGERTVRRTIKSLRSEKRGILFLVKRRGGLQNEYGMNLSELRGATAAGLDLTDNHARGARGARVAPLEVPERQVRPATVAPKPSVKPSVDPSDLNADKPRNPRQQDLHFEALADITNLTPPERDWGKMTKTARGQLNRYAKELREACGTPEQIYGFMPWFQRNDWRGKAGQFPAPADVVKLWPAYLNGDRKNGTGHQGSGKTQLGEAERERRQALVDKINAQRAAKRGVA